MQLRVGRSFLNIGISSIFVSIVSWQNGPSSFNLSNLQDVSVFGGDVVGLDEVAGTLDQLRLDRKRIIGDVINIIIIICCDFDFVDRKERLQSSSDNPSNILSSLLFGLMSLTMTVTGLTVETSLTAILRPIPKVEINCRPLIRTPIRKSHQVLDLFSYPRSSKSGRSCHCQWGEEW